MSTCPSCHQPASKRDGPAAAGGQRYTCRPCGRDFTAHSASAFAGYRWPPEVSLLAVRWSLSHPLFATSVMEVLAERGIDVSTRTLLRWVQTCGPWLAAEVRRPRRPLGSKCSVDEVCFFRGTEKRSLSRAVDEHGQVVDVLVREHRDTESALAFFRQALARTGWRPTQVSSDHHQPSVKAVQEMLPEAAHVRTGLHRARGETTKPIERSHVFTRDRLRASRGVKTLATGQCFFEGFEALHARRRGHTRLTELVPGLVPGFAPTHATAHGRVHARWRAVAQAVTALGSRLTKTALVAA
jgi:transposase-like protein